MSIHSHIFTLFLLLLALLLSASIPITGHEFSIKEATVHDFRMAFQQNKLTSRKLVRFYLGEIHKLNPILRGVIEVNPDALLQADKADKEKKAKSLRSLRGLHGIPILLKDNIATKDKMNTTAGSFALLKSVVPRDAGVNPYVLSATPCGSSSGSAISVAANLAAVSLGTETMGSILCPSHFNSVVGIKPTVGLTSRAGVVPISPRQDTVGPICRTVSDAVEVLDVIVGFDKRDKATRTASKYIPRGGYKQFLNANGLKGKRLGIVRNPPYMFENVSVQPQVFEHHFHTLRQGGAVLVDHLKIANIDVSLAPPE
ncbi:putative amidase C869.01 [Vitis vinifera]|uniref:Putative amidase C869.01 n=1 Tax=Vitis vinifera TaxID=29760 RepID=A0A438IIR4_VITVI|nr:putative amidase C869.01 [Vitis vinifera]